MDEIVGEDIRRLLFTDLSVVGNQLIGLLYTSALFVCSFQPVSKLLFLLL